MIDLWQTVTVYVLKKKYQQLRLIFEKKIEKGLC